MRTIATDILLAVAVLASWLAAAGLLRLRTPLDRMHCVTFLNVAAGLALLLAGLATEGVTIRVVKLLLLNLGALWIGAALANATGRALWLRDRER